MGIKRRNDWPPEKWSLPKIIEKSLIFANYAAIGFAQYLEQNTTNDDWDSFGRFFAKQQILSCETNENDFVDLIYGTLETAYHFHIIHLSKNGSLVFSLSFLLQLHFVWLQEPDSLLTTQGSAISSSPSSNIRTSGWSLHNQMTLAFRGAFIVPELLSDSRMICCHLTFLSAIDRHDMLHEALGYHASSSLCLSLNCSFSDSFMSVFSGRSHHLLFPSRS